MTIERPPQRDPVGARGAPRLRAGRTGVAPSVQPGPEAARPGLARRSITRVGTGPLVALCAALLLLAVAAAVMLVPGLVLPADAETTSSTDATTDPTAQTVTSDTSPAVPGSADPVPAGVAPGRLLVTLPWGQGAGQVGLVHPDEGLTRGPEALAVAPDGRIAVLDSVNRRLVVLGADGSFTRQVPLELTEPRFLAVNDGVIYVLDADADRQIVALDWAGALLHDDAIPTLDDVVSGLLATEDGPCIEVAHDSVYLVDFRDAPGQTGSAAKPGRAALRAAPGRPLDLDLSKAVKATFDSEAGVKLKRFKVDKKTLKGTQTQALAPRFSCKALEHLVSLDGDGLGGLIIGARLLRAKGDPADGPALIIGRLAAGSVTADPVLTDTLTLCDSPFAYLGEPYTVSPDGRVFQPVGTDLGYTITVYTLPGGASGDAGTDTTVTGVVGGAADAGAADGALSMGVQS